MKAIIIDDETKARQLLEAMLVELCPDVEVLSSCNNLSSGVKAIKLFKPDVVFLDIEMPGHSGLQLLDFLVEEEITFDIVFVTAYNEYAINAFKLEAIDYLLKPVDAEQLIQAVERCKRKRQKDFDKYQLLKHRFSSSNQEKLAISQLDGVLLVPHQNILYLEGDGSYTKVVCRDSSVYTASRNLKYFEGVLSTNEDFFRCHKSYIINLSQVVGLTRGDRVTAKLMDTEVSVSIDKVEELRVLLGMNK
jgi:two-component system LytT family response regulator